MRRVLYGRLETVHEVSIHRAPRPAQGATHHCGPRAKLGRETEETQETHIQTGPRSSNKAQQKRQREGIRPELNGSRIAADSSMYTRITTGMGYSTVSQRLGNTRDDPQRGRRKKELHAEMETAVETRIRQRQRERETVMETESGVHRQGQVATTCNIHALPIQQENSGRDRKSRGGAASCRALREESGSSGGTYRIGRCAGRSNSSARTPAENTHHRQGHPSEERRQFVHMMAWLCAHARMSPKGVEDRIGRCCTAN